MNLQKMEKTHVERQKTPFLISEGSMILHPGHREQGLFRKSTNPAGGNLCLTPGSARGIY
jgi:hypothetical protein